jgi:hypothetical protein
MTTRIERYCETCLTEPMHERRGGTFICTQCGTVTASLVEPTNGIGVSDRGASSEGVSDRGDTHPSVTTLAYTATAYAEKLCADELAALDGDPDFARFLSTKAGIRFTQDDPQPVALGEQTLTVRWWIDDHDRYVIRAVGEGRSPVFPGTNIQALKAGQFYATLCAGRIIRPTGPSLARWKRRALAEADLIALPSVVLKPLPGDAPPYLARVWLTIGLLVQVRRLVDPDETRLPLEWTFLADWCGCDEIDVRRGRAWLDRHGFIWRAGLVAVGKPKPMVLWGIAEEPTTESAWLNAPARGEIEREQARAPFLGSDEAS